MLTDPEITKIQQQATAQILAGDLIRAGEVLRPALQRFPHAVPLLNAWGIVSLRQRRPDLAAKAFQTSLQQAPQQPTVCFNLSICLQQRGDLAGALAALDTAIRLKPDFAEAFSARGFLQLRQNHLSDAEKSYAAALAADPGNATYANNLGGLRLAQNKPEAALAAFDIALKSQPGFHEAWSNFGQALEKLKRYDQALSAYDQAIARAPKHSGHYMRKGIVLREMGRLKESADALEHALQLKPDQAILWRQHGITCKALKDIRGAIRDFRQTIALEPQQAENHNLLGNMLAQNLQFREALTAYDRAIELQPDFAWAYNNRGNAHKELGDLAAARTDFSHAIALSQDTAVFRWNKSLLELLTGHFDKGWEMFESRWERRIITTVKENQQYPRWNGEKDIAGKTILLHAEQGLGDSIQFSRYVPMVAALGAKIVLSVQPGLMEVMKTLPADITITTRHRPLPSIDLQCPLMSLPKAFKTELKTIPAEVPYLHADAQKAKLWAQKLGPKTRPRIGLVWSGNAGLLPDKSRSIPAKLLAPLAGLPFEFHCLQKQIRAEDDDALGRMGPIARHESDFGDFADTAALIHHMDLVISVDTSVAHMSGALGKPLWVLLPFAPDWRWLLEREDSPWYPSARLFRQHEKGNWEEVLARVAAALKQTF